MKVFISWSGERSKAVATLIHEHLPLVVDEKVLPWMSQSDIDAGKQWSTEIRKALAESSFGVACVTPENMRAPWLSFEAGAVAKAVEDDAQLVPLLLGLAEAELDGPLAEFQAKQLDRDGLSATFRAISAAMGQARPELVAARFEAVWPKLEKRISSIPAPSEATTPHRGQGEMLEEVISRVRALDNTVQARLGRFDASTNPIEASRLDKIAEFVGDLDSVRAEVFLRFIESHGHLSVRFRNALRSFLNAYEAKSGAAVEDSFEPLVAAIRRELRGSAIYARATEAAETLRLFS